MRFWLSFSSIYSRHHLCNIRPTYGISYHDFQQFQHAAFPDRIHAQSNMKVGCHWYYFNLMFTIYSSGLHTCLLYLPILIRRKIFHSSGMAPSEWTGSVRDARDTPVADFSGPSVNTIHRVVYRPTIAVSLSLRVLLVSYFKQSLWGCGQLWQSVGIGSMGTRLHRDGAEMGDAANISPRVPSTCAQNAVLFLLIIHVIPSRQIYVAIDNTSLVPSVSCLTTSSYFWN
jgi:hypothetical protein